MKQGIDYTLTIGLSVRDVSIKCTGLQLVGISYPVTRRHMPEERIPELHR
jgi:hypothetical protein